jgi:hypothetical protein
MANKEQKSNRETKKKKKPAKKDSSTAAATATAKVPVFKDPTQSIWGKVVIWILIFGMGALIIVALIYANIRAA